MITDSLKITVVTPNFNRGKFIESTILSILKQDYSNLEYIVIDGGSIDGSVETIRKYESRLAHWESRPDRGQYDAIQKGFDISSGEIMAYLNSDDLYFPWTFYVVNQIFSKFPQVEWLTTSCISATPPNGLFPLIFNRYNRSRRRFFQKNRNRLPFLQQEATFWRRSLWEKAGARLSGDLKFAGDFELWARFYAYATPVTVQIPLAMFRVHDEQKSSNLDGYIAETESVLKKYSSLHSFPRVFVRWINFVYRLFNLRSDYFGLRSDSIIYKFDEYKWVYDKKLEWRD